MAPKELKAFDTFMKTVCGPYGTYWNKAVLDWVQSKNPDDIWEHKDDYQLLTIPDYTLTSINRYNGSGKGYVHNRRR